MATGAEEAKKAKAAWDRILSGEKHLSDEEAADMHALVKELRKERWFPRNR